MCAKSTPYFCQATHDHNYVSKPIKNPTLTLPMKNNTIGKLVLDLAVKADRMMDDQRKKPKYQIRCAVLRSSDIVYGIRVQQLKRRKKYVRREKVKLESFGPLNERQAHAAVMALDTSLINKPKGRGSKRKRSHVPPAQQYQTMFERFVNSRQENELPSD